MKTICQAIINLELEVLDRDMQGQQREGEIKVATTNYMKTILKHLKSDEKKHDHGGESQRIACISIP